MWQTEARCGWRVACIGARSASVLCNGRDFMSRSMYHPSDRNGLNLRQPDRVVALRRGGDARIGPHAASGLIVRPRELVSIRQQTHQARMVTARVEGGPEPHTAHVDACCPLPRKPTEQASRVESILTRVAVCRPVLPVR